MKKLLLILGVIISIATTSANAEKTTSRADVHRYSHESSRHGINRMPARLPEIYIAHDSDTGSIEIVCSEDYEATVWLYNENGVVDYSEALNTTFQIPAACNSTYKIKIESANWYATATVVI